MPHDKPAGLPADPTAAAPGVLRRRRSAWSAARSVLAAALRRDWAVPISVTGMVALAFVAGLAVSELRVYPSQVVAAAAEAARDWRDNWRHHLRIQSRFAVRAERSGQGVTVNDPKAAFPGYTFVTAYRDGQFGAALLDMGGTVRQEWRVAFSQVWPEPRHLSTVPLDYDLAVHGAALMPGGDVVLNLEGGGTVALDRCSRIKWSVAKESHHVVEPLPEGGFLIAGRRVMTRPGPGLPGVRVPAKGWMWEDTVVRVGPRGEVVEEFSVIEALLASGLESVLYANGKVDTKLSDTDDPLHLNDIEVLRPEMAAAFPLFAPGDIMVSMLSLNTIAVLDPRTKKFKWWMTGPFLRQHDPDFLPNGNILVFDNRKGGRRQEFGQSQVLEIDPATRRVVWSYAGSAGEPFYTDALGKLQQLPNGNVLVTEAQKGRVFELARNPAGGGRIVWEWINGIGDGLVGWVSQADRVGADQVDFLGQSCG